MSPKIEIAAFVVLTGLGIIGYHSTKVEKIDYKKEYDKILVRIDSLDSNTSKLIDTVKYYKNPR